MTTAYDEYLESKVMTATPHQLHLMVIDGAIRHAAAAEQALQQKQFDQARTSLSQSGRFVAEMIAGLDGKRMPELVESLKSLFVFVQRNLLQADANRDANTVRNALRILRLHRENWLALAEKLKQESTAKESSAGGGFLLEHVRV
jgi:flagellar secretion chaperone FliS